MEVLIGLAVNVVTAPPHGFGMWDSFSGVGVVGFVGVFGVGFVGVGVVVGVSVPSLKEIVIWKLLSCAFE